MATFGVTNDYVINFVTNTAVFMLPPIAGTKIQIVTIGAGGSGQQMEDVYVVDSGTNYAVNDMITLNGGYGSLANITVTTVQVSDSYYLFGWDILAWDTSPWSYTGGDPALIISGGNNYVVGDELILAVDSNTVVTTRAELTVTGTDTVTGTITSLALTEPGNYTVIPATQIWETNGQGSNVNVLVAWGASTFTVNNSGFYFVPPNQPITQLSTTGQGMYLTVDAAYTSTQGTDTFTGDGTTNTFALTFAVANVANMLVTLDGVVIPADKLSLTGLSTLVLATPPAANTTLIVVGFSTSSFSIVNDQTFTIQSGQQYYQLNILPSSSLPPYNSILVLRNGLALKPPPMANYIGDGNTTVYTMDVEIVSSDLAVYVNNILVNDYSVIDYKVIFVTPPPSGAKVAMVVTNLNTGFDFDITGTNIFLPNVQAGDVMRVITFTEDYSYGWVADGFYSHGWDIALWNFSWNYGGGSPAQNLGGGKYQLSQEATDPDSMMVFVEGNLKSPQWDYTVDTARVTTNIITNVQSTSNNVYVTTGSNISGVTVGMLIEGNTIPADTYVQGVYIHSGRNIITLSQPALDTGLTTFTTNVDTSIVKFNPDYAPDIDDNVVVAYTTFPVNALPIAWRTLISDSGTAISTAIDDVRKTFIISNVYTYSNEITVADVTAIGPAPGAIWIDDELITYQKVLLTPTAQYPNQGILSELSRGAGTTSYSPQSSYDTLYYYGDGVTRYFAASSAVYPLAETVYVDNVVQINSAFYPGLGTYSSTSTGIPSDLPPGRYIVFNTAPKPGWRNIRITALTANFDNMTSVHVIGSDVIDASKAVALPGGYNWEPAINGLQRSNSKQAKFLISHSGTRS